MRVTHLSLRDFRNYVTADVDFLPGLNLVIGRNGQGKTNLVEAIAYFATLSSHRVSNETALIRAGADAAIARMQISARDRAVLLEIQLNKGTPNRAQVNRNAVRPRELQRWFSTVVFAPEDLSIVRGDPARRRSFLDEALTAHQPSMISVLSDYDRVVRQRTSLLKSARASGSKSALDATLGLWDTQLIELGSRIMFERRNLVAKLVIPLARAYSELVGADHSPTLTMNESVLQTTSAHDVSRETPAAGTQVFDDENATHDRRVFPNVSRETIAEEFRAALEILRPQEAERALTLAGPHRDDVDLGLNELPVKGYASHGESWSFALSLRLSLADLIRKDSPSGDPVIILDDVFAELDARRRAQLLAAVRDFEQVIVTAAVDEDVPNDSNWNRIRINAGEVVTSLEAL